jgi:hypothetical protein
MVVDNEKGTTAVVAEWAAGVFADRPASEGAVGRRLPAKLLRLQLIVTPAQAGVQQQPNVLGSRPGQIPAGAGSHTRERRDMSSLDPQ